MKISLMTRKVMTRKVSRKVSGAVLSMALLLGATASAQAAGEVNIYSFRQPGLLDPILKTFSEKTGVKVNVIFAKDGLIERIQAEGQNSPADVLLTVDIGLTTKAVAADIVQPVTSDAISKNIPANYRDSQGKWFALTRRSRVVYASVDRVKQDAITYEELADPKWKGKICVRSGQHAYNTAMIASIIAHSGEEKAKTWLKGVKDNLAHKPSGGDRDQVKEIYAGKCDLAIGNTYYMGLMQTNDKKPEEKDWAKSAKILFPNTADRGAHMNVSTMLLAKNAPNKEAALKLMEYLASEEAQKLYASLNHEYPVKDGIAWSETVKGWGEFKADGVALEEIGKHIKRASELVDEVGFDNGPGA